MIRGWSFKENIMQSKEMYRQVIMDHYKNPSNRVSEDVEGYLKREALNPSCGDTIKIYLLIEDGIVKDIKFNGEGCSICCSSASVMTNEFMGLTIEELKSKVENFHDIIKDADEEHLEDFEDGQVFIGIKDFPARFKCAYLSWDTAKKLVEENNG